jgi:hypothetical protein
MLIEKCPYDNLLKQAFTGGKYCFIDFNSKYFSSIIEVLRKMQTHKSIYLTFNTFAELEGCKSSIVRFFLDNYSVLSFIQFESIEKKKEEGLELVKQLSQTQAETVADTNYTYDDSY